MRRFSVFRASFAWTFGKLLAELANFLLVGGLMLLAAFLVAKYGH